MNEIKKSYRFVLIMTIIVIVVSISIILSNGYSSSQNDSTMFVAIYSLFNIYLYVISFLYSPSLESLEELQFK